MFQQIAPDHSYPLFFYLLSFDDQLLIFSPFSSSFPFPFPFSSSLIIFFHYLFRSLPFIPFLLILLNSSRHWLLPAPPLFGGRSFPLQPPLFFVVKENRLCFLYLFSRSINARMKNRIFNFMATRTSLGISLVKLELIFHHSSTIR